MNLNLSGKVAAVTGASKGIGLAVTNALAREVVCVAAGARDISEELTTLAANSQVHPVSVDLTEEGGPGRLVAEAISAYGGLDILVNNVGAVRPRLGGFLSITDDDWSSTLAINFFAAVRTTRAALPLMLERGTGTIVTICSVNSFLPRSAGHGLQRGEGCAGELLQSTVQRGWSARYPGQHGQPWAR